MEFKKKKQLQDTAGENGTHIETAGPSESAKASRKGRVKTIALIVLAAAILIAGTWSFAAFSESSSTFTTDNAKVTAKMFTISPVTAGKLLEWNVREGDQVNQNQVLGRQEVLPYITSPIHGTVVKSNAVAGQLVSPTVQLAVVADTDNLYIGVNVEETDITRIKIGQPVDVKIDAYPGKTFKGQVTEIDQATQTFFSSTSSFSTSGTYTKVKQLVPVKVVIENPDSLPLTFGMNATVKIYTKAAVPAPGATTGPEATAKPAALSAYTSSIEAAEWVAVAPNVSGKVATIEVAVGLPVKTGDTLFTLDTADLQLQFNQAKASLAPAQTAYNDATAQVTRMQKLFEAGAVSKVDRDGAKSKAEAAKGQLEAAQAAIAILQKKLDDCVVKAPIDGDVSLKSISIGSLAAPNTPAITVINTRNVLVHINVTEAAIGSIKAGDRAAVTVQSIPVQTTGTILSVAPACDAKTGLFPVEIRIDNTDGQLKPGMMADVDLQPAA